MPNVTVSLSPEDTELLVRTAERELLSATDMAGIVLRRYLRARRTARKMESRDAELLAALTVQFREEEFTAADAAALIGPGANIPPGRRVVMAGVALARLREALVEDDRATVSMEVREGGARKRFYRIIDAA